MSAVELQSKDHRDLLDIIDRLREQGISRYVDLPQIIVVGDQSSGKSSVLEAISKMSFPVKDNLCTRFATELILRRDGTSSIKISIVPALDRSPAEKERLAGVQFDEHDKIDLSDVVEKARKAMGICETKVFATDILRVELSGPTQPHLTMVDLPGLFRAGNRDQSVKDAQVVHDMVHAYMARQRSIIVAVVSAKSDFALQEITELARAVDPEGMRTLGLITKPDTLDAGSESETQYFNLSKNTDVKFRLGWHVLKNRSFATKDYSSTERDEDEARFFDTGIWKSMDRKALGVKTLVPRLSGVLKEQILAQLPSLIADINSSLGECKQRLTQLGIARNSEDKQRQYLIKISEQFTQLVNAAVMGNYTNPFFGDARSSKGFDKRLRAQVQEKLQEFVQVMNKKGRSKRSKQQSYIEEVKETMKRNKGRELPGTFNPDIIGILFSQTCRPWKQIAKLVKRDIMEITNDFVLVVARHVTVEETLDAVSAFLKDGLDELNKDMTAKVREVLEPFLSGHPITYNHYLTDNIQKLQKQRRDKSLKTLMKAHVNSRPPADATDLKAFLADRDAAMLAAIQQGIQPDMDDFAAELAIDATMAYYKVAKKTFVDIISILAVEACLMQKLEHLFTPSMIQRMDTAGVARLAAEGSDIAEERQRQTDKLTILSIALANLRKLDKHRIVFSDGMEEADDSDDDDESIAEMWKAGRQNDSLDEQDIDEEENDESEDESDAEDNDNDW